MVVPHNGAAFIRDVSHTGTNSLQFPTTNNAATGITGGGPDSLSVGSALNTNGIIYDVFVFPGSTTAGNGGFSINGEFIVVAPDSPTGGDVFGGGLWDGTPPDPELNPDEPDSGGGTPDIPDLPDGVPGTDFGTSCVDSTTFLINQALSLIGSRSRSATSRRSCRRKATDGRGCTGSTTVGATLRAFPWNFATRYARLVLVGGTSTVPVNNDWQYSYRMPSDAVFSRRITNPSMVQRRYDETPVDFRVGSDSTGGLIYTNQAPTDDNDLTPELEYTVRTDCAALQRRPYLPTRAGVAACGQLGPGAGEGREETAVLPGHVRQDDRRSGNGRRQRGAEGPRG
jgi:hypothetical protein